MTLINTVQLTSDYSIFTKMEGNRTLNMLSVNRLKKLFKNGSHCVPIIVNDKKEVIDGQHRLEALKQLNMPVPYIVSEGLNINDVHCINSAGKLWSSADYVNGYADAGNEHYIKLIDMIKKYPDFTVGFLASVFCWKQAGVSGYMLRDLREGKFKFNFPENERELIFISKIKPFFSGITAAMPSSAIRKALAHPLFETDVFLKKLSRQSTKLVRCASGAQYLSLIEEIYNHHSKIKINLRFPNAK